MGCEYSGGRKAKTALSRAAEDVSPGLPQPAASQDWMNLCCWSHYVCIIDSCGSRDRGVPDVSFDGEEKGLISLPLRARVWGSGSELSADTDAEPADTRGLLTLNPQRPQKPRCHQPSQNSASSSPFTAHAGDHEGASITQPQQMWPGVRDRKFSASRVCRGENCGL